MKLDPDQAALAAEHFGLARVTTRHLRQVDAEAIALLAIVESAGRYDPTLGASFATFARRRIAGAVIDVVRRETMGNSRQARRHAQVLRDRDHSNPVDPVELREAEAAASAVVRLHLDQPVEGSDPDVSTFADLLGEPDQSEDVAASLDLLRAMKNLTDYQQEVLVLRFFYDVPVKEIAASLGSTPSAISITTKTALDRLRNMLEGPDRDGDDEMTRRTWKRRTEKTPQPSRRVRKDAKTGSRRIEQWDPETKSWRPIDRIAGFRS